MEIGRFPKVSLPTNAKTDDLAFRIMRAALWAHPRRRIFGGSDDFFILVTAFSANIVEKRHLSRKSRPSLESSKASCFKTMWNDPIAQLDRALAF